MPLNQNTVSILEHEHQKHSVLNQLKNLNAQLKNTEDFKVNHYLLKVLFLR